MPQYTLPSFLIIAIIMGHVLLLLNATGLYACAKLFATLQSSSRSDICYTALTFLHIPSPWLRPENVLMHQSPLSGKICDVF